jgi:hypothetical protein
MNAQYAASCEELKNIHHECWNEDRLSTFSIPENAMSRTRTEAIHFDRHGGVLLYDGAQGKTVQGIRISQGDQAIFVVLAFTDQTELAISLTSLSAVMVSLSALNSAVDDELEPIAESRRTLLPNLSSPIQWDEIEHPPAEGKSRRQ